MQIASRAFASLMPWPPPDAGKGTQEEIGRAEIAGFERQASGGLAEAHRPRHAGIDLPADAQPGHAERLHDRARGLAAGDDQPPHAARDEAAGDRRRGCLRPARRPAPGRVAPGLRRPASGGAVARNQDRLCRRAAALPRPAPPRRRYRPAAAASGSIVKTGRAFAANRRPAPASRSEHEPDSTAAGPSIGGRVSAAAASPSRPAAAEIRRAARARCRSRR